MTPGRLVFPSSEPTMRSAPHEPSKAPDGDQYGKYFPANPATLDLESNFGPMDPATIGYLQPTPADAPLEVMEERCQRDGYLFLKGLLPVEPVLQCRAAYFSHMAPSGLLRPGSDPVSGTYSGANPRKYLRPGNLRRLFGLKNDPDSDRYVDLRASPPTSLTAWVPIGGVSLEGDGLMYLQNSTDIGRQTELDSTANVKNLTDEERISAFNKNMNDGGFLSRDTVRYGKEQKRRWLIAEYEVGDVIFHNPYMVHASCKNKDPNNIIRLATDLRFVDPDKPYDERWMKVYRPLDGL
ncbi:hypothetical protein F4678DRAFT_420392 [Xylaria arbuscula]|nr:hypothetical protein F4678DRAFT_420392 [Xylaria arbuscula]